MKEKIEFSLMTTAILFEILKRAEDVKEEELATEKKYSEMFQMVSDTGIHAVEITSLELDLFGLSFIKAVLSQNNLKVAGVVHLDTFAEPQRDNTDMFEKAKRAVDQAVSLGSRMVMLALAPHEEINRYTIREMQEALKANIKPIAAYGKECGVKVSVEDTPEVELPLCSIRELHILMDEIPDLYLTYDSGNMLIKKEGPAAYYAAFEKRICHIHLKDMQYVANGQEGDKDLDGNRLSGALHGKGIVDFDVLAEQMKKSSYEGYAVIEYVGHGNHQKHINEAVSFFQDKFKI